MIAWSLFLLLDADSIGLGLNNDEGLASTSSQQQQQQHLQQQQQQQRLPRESTYYTFTERKINAETAIMF